LPASPLSPAALTYQPLLPRLSRLPLTPNHYASSASPLTFRPRPPHHVLALACWTAPAGVWAVLCDLLGGRGLTAPPLLVSHAVPRPTSISSPQPLTFLLPSFISWVLPTLRPRRGCSRACAACGSTRPTKPSWQQTKWQSVSRPTLPCGSPPSTSPPSGCPTLALHSAWARASPRLLGLSTTPHHTVLIAAPSLPATTPPLHPPSSAHKRTRPHRASVPPTHKQCPLPPTPHHPSTPLTSSPLPRHLPSSPLPRHLPPLPRHLPSLRQVRPRVCAYRGGRRGPGCRPCPLLCGLGGDGPSAPA
jgi:hypothetical protein